MRQLSFRVLGPLKAEMDGEPVRLGGTRQRKVLAMLLLRPGQVVSVDGLTEAVWQGAPPTTARNQIAICITALRRIFRSAARDDGLIRTAHNGYSLIRGIHSIDVEDMHSLLADARAAAGNSLAEASAKFEQLLDMWYGSPLEGLTGGNLDLTATQLNDLWLDINEEYAELQLAMRQYRSAAELLSTLVEKHPLREQARLQLMTAQHLAGRRADALETYRVGRKVLVEELGIEPGPALQQLHRRILLDADVAGIDDRPEQAPAPVRTAVPAQLPLPAACFTGREEHLTALDKLLHSSTGEHLAIAALSGVSGVGKSALAIHWANRVAEHFPDGQLFLDLRGYDKHEQPVSPMNVLDSCLRALGVDGSRIPPELHERSALYRTLLDAKRILIVLDNARSISQILPLMPGRGQCCVVITSRDPLDHLTGDYPVLRLALRPLSVYESCRMLESMIGLERVAAEPAMAVRLAELCDRLPLPLRIAGAQLVTKPHRMLRQLVGRLEDRRRRLDLLSPEHGGLRAEFWLSYRELPPEAARMYRRLGLVGLSDFPSWVGAAVMDISVDQAEDLMDQLVDAQLMEVGTKYSGCTRFRFLDLLRLFACERSYEEDTEDEREAALDRAFDTLLKLADTAHQQLSGKGHIAPLPTLSGGDLDAQEIEVILGRPMDWLEHERTLIVDSVRHCAQSGRSLHAWALTIRAIPLFETRGYPEDWHATTDCALRAAREAGDTLGTGSMLHSLGALAIYQRRYQEAESLLMLAMDSLATTGEIQGQALVLRNLAVCARFAGRLGDAAQHCRAALDLFRRTEDVSGRAHTLGLLAQIELELGDIQLGIALTRQALTMGEGASSLRSRTQNIYRLAEALLRGDEPEEAEKASREAIELTRSQGDRMGEAYGLRALGEAQWRQFLLIEAKVSLLEAHTAAGDVGDDFLRARIEVDLACVLSLRAQNETSASHGRRALGTFRRLQAPMWELRAVRLLELLDTLDAETPPAIKDLTRALGLS